MKHEFKPIKIEKPDIEFATWYERQLKWIFGVFQIPYELLKEEKLKYIESPEELLGDDAMYDSTMFLAGGITGCPNWQKTMVGKLKATPLTLINPRRENFPIDDPLAAEAQITWEHRHLRRSSSILFWFCAETVCPIVLYELGAWSMTRKPIFVGVDPEYIRKQDVEIQTALARPEVTVVYTLEALALQVADYFEMGRVMENGELHTVYYNEKVGERSKSIQVRMDDQLEWFSKEHMSHVRQEDGIHAFDIPLWLAVRKGLI